MSALPPAKQNVFSPLFEIVRTLVVHLFLLNYKLCLCSFYVNYLCNKFNSMKAIYGAWDYFN